MEKEEPSFRRCYLQRGLGPVLPSNVLHSLSLTCTLSIYLSVCLPIGYIYIYNREREKERQRQREAERETPIVSASCQVGLHAKACVATGARRPESCRGP